MTTITTAPGGIVAWWLDSSGLHSASLAGWDELGAPLIVGLDGSLASAAPRLLTLPWLPQGERPQGWAHAAVLADLDAITGAEIEQLDRSGVVRGAIAAYAAWVRRAARATGVARDVVTEVRRHDEQLEAVLAESSTEATSELAQMFVRTAAATVSAGSVW